MHCEGPNARLYTFVGNLHVLGGPEELGAKPGAVVPLGPSAVLLRGCSLRNTDWVLAAAVYTGAPLLVL